MVDFTTAISFKLWLEGLVAVSQRQYVFEVSEWWLRYGHSCWSWQRDLDRERLSVSDPAPENFPVVTLQLSRYGFQVREA